MRGSIMILLKKNNVNLDFTREAGIFQIMKINNHYTNVKQQFHILQI